MKLEDFGLFLSVMTMPFGKEKDFFQLEVKNLFEQHRENLINNFSDKDDRKISNDRTFGNLYKPKGYCLMGSFDLAVIAYVRDFALAVRKFHPFSPLINSKLKVHNDRVHSENLSKDKSFIEKKDEEDYVYNLRVDEYNRDITKSTQLDTKYLPSNYTFHIVSGILPQSEERKLDYNQVAKETFLHTATVLYEDKSTSELDLSLNTNYPFVGICSLKLNNALLIGNGLDFLEPVIKKMREILEEGTGIDKNFRYVLSNTVSWHELTLICFSNDYRVITERLLKVRELCLGDLENCDKIEEACLQKKFDQEHIKKSHVFVNSYTNFGYDLEILHATTEEKEEIAKKIGEGVNFYMRWFVKPGHLQSFREEIEKKLKKIIDKKRSDLRAQYEDREEEITERIEAEIKEKIPDNFNPKLVIGRGDYAYSIKGQEISLFHEIMANQANEKNTISKHIRNMYALPEIGLNGGQDIFSDLPKVDLDEHPLFHSQLYRFSFSTKDIEEIRELLTKLKVSKIIKEKVTNMYVVYNDGIFDPVLYGHFIELKVFLEEIKEVLKTFIEEGEISVSEVSEQLNKHTTVFELAYRNRYGQSYILNEITDFNIEMNGGIQQLISTYDVLYKNLVKVINGQIDSIAYVSSHPLITSTQYTVRLNYFHLFQPEIFLAAAVHEATNHYWLRLGDEGDLYQKYLALEKVNFEKIEKKFGLKKDKFSIIESELKSLFESVYEKNKSSKEDKSNLSFNMIKEYFKNDVYSEEELRIIASALKYFLVDASSFYLTHNGYFSSFFRWHWAVFIQQSNFYNVDGSVNDALFKEFLLRMILVEEEFSLTNSNSFLRKLLPPTLSIQIIKAWEKNISWVLDTSNKILTSDLIKNDFLGKLKKLITALVYDQLILREQSTKPNNEIKPNKEYEEKIYDTLNLIEGYSATKDRSLTHLLRLRSNLFDAIRIEMNAFLNIGVINISEVEKKLEPKYKEIIKDIPKSFMYLVMIYTILEKFEATLEIKNEDNLVPRDKESGKINLTNKQNGNSYFDQTGGSFITCPQKQKEYFLLRAKTIYSLWDLSLRQKKELFFDNVEV